MWAVGSVYLGSEILRTLHCLFPTSSFQAVEEPVCNWVVQFRSGLPNSWKREQLTYNKQHVSLMCACHQHPNKFQSLLGEKAAPSVPSHCAPTSQIWKLKYFQMCESMRLGSCFLNDSTPLRGNAAWVPEFFKIAKIAFTCFSREWLLPPCHCTSTSLAYFSPVGESRMNVTGWGETWWKTSIFYKTHWGVFQGGGRE